MAPEPSPQASGVAAEPAAAEATTVRVLTRPSARAPEPLSPTTVHGATAALLALPFLGMGVWVVLLSSGAVAAKEGTFPAGRLVGGAAGGLFGAAGLWLLVHGLRGIVRTRRAKGAAVRFGHAPWRFDRAWKRDGEDAHRWAALVSPALGTLLFGAFAAIPALLAAAAPDPPFVVGAAAVGMALLTLVPAAQLLARLVQAVRYGRTYVRWARFPAFAGEELTLRFGVGRDDTGFERLVFRLRCVQEAYEPDAEGATRVVCRTLHDDEQVVEGPGRMPRPGLDTTVRFHVPAGLPGNDLVARPARWWELEVAAETDGPDYRERFVLPVYGRSEPEGPAPAAAAASELAAASTR
jgi:hypothetical protein